MPKTIIMQKRELTPKLFVIQGKAITSVDVSERMLVGRQTEQNNVDINLNAPFVSRKHGEFGKDDKGYYYTDTGSTNGTYHNGEKITAHNKKYLTDGDVLHIFSGQYNTDNEFVALVFATDYLDKWSCEEISLSKEIAEINIGRTGSKNVLMSDDTVSANHASFFVAKSGWAIVDHKSTNGVYLNNHRLENAKYLKVGDCIRIVNTLFVFLGDKLLYQKNIVTPKASSDHPSPKYMMGDALDIRIAERSVWQRAKKLMLLQNINMRINAGEMVLILGGSGAGKTTFMNAVMGYEKAEGQILHGDTDVYEDFESMKYKIGFVPQQDLLRGSDTVYDTLENAAEMKLPSSIKKERREERIESVLNTLGLSRERDSLVSKLSGGQRKRLSIAVEYIADPSLFFLDEPDSGLDGVMSRALMNNLRHIADEGKIVMVISHGPDRASDLFDKVIVLAKSVQDNCGHLAFFGSVSEAYDFFDTDTLEGVVRRINRKDEGGDGMSDYYIQKYNNQL